MNDQERAAMQQALEALEHHGGRLPWVTFVEVPNALKAALALAQEQAEPAQEPVAWMVEGSLYASKEVAQKMGGNAYTLQALYTAPQPQRPPLTDEEIRAHADKHLRYQPQSYEASGVFDLVRAIERKVRGETE